jgi:hypothetical protein
MIERSAPMLRRGPGCFASVRRPRPVRGGENRAGSRIGSGGRPGRTKVAGQPRRRPVDCAYTGSKVAKPRLWKNSRICRAGPQLYLFNIQRAANKDFSHLRPVRKIYWMTESEPASIYSHCFDSRERRNFADMAEDCLKAAC